MSIALLKLGLLRETKVKISAADILTFSLMKHSSNSKNAGFYNSHNTSSTVFLYILPVWKRPKSFKLKDALVSEQTKAAFSVTHQNIVCVSWLPNNHIECVSIHIKPLQSRIFMFVGALQQLELVETKNRAKRE